MPETSQNNPGLLTLCIYPEIISLNMNDEKSGSVKLTKRVELNWENFTTEQLVDELKAETNFNFTSLRIIFASNQYVLIPVEIFKIEEATDFLLFEHKPAPTDAVLFNRIQKYGLVNVFAIPGNLYEAIHRIFTDVAIEHQQTEFLTDFTDIANQNSIYCRERKGMLDVVCIKEGKLQLVNSYEAKTPEDYLYFTLNVYDKLKMDTKKDQLFISKNSSEEIQQLFSNYLLINNI